MQICKDLRNDVIVNPRTCVVCIAFLRFLKIEHVIRFFFFRSPFLNAASYEANHSRQIMAQKRVQLGNLQLFDAAQEGLPIGLDHTSNPTHWANPWPKRMRQTTGPSGPLGGQQSGPMICRVSIQTCWAHLMTRLVRISFLSIFLRVLFQGFEVRFFFDLSSSCNQRTKRIQQESQGWSSLQIYVKEFL